LPRLKPKPKEGKNAFREEELLELGRKHFAEDFPNPKHQGCPPKDQLKLLAERSRESRESVLNHISFCSPCYRTYSRFLQKQKARLRREENKKRAPASKPRPA
jgi:hypothetical protein